MVINLQLELPAGRCQVCLPYPVEVLDGEMQQHIHGVSATGLSRADGYPGRCSCGGSEQSAKQAMHTGELLLSRSLMHACLSK